MYKNVIPSLTRYPELSAISQLTLHLAGETVARDNEHLMELLNNVSGIPGVVATETMICWAERKARIPIMQEI